MNRDNTGYTETLRYTGSGYVPPPYFQVAEDKIYASFVDNSGGGKILTGEMDIDHTNWTDTQRSGPSGTKHRIELHVVKDKIYYVYMNEVGGIWQVWTARMNTDGTGWTTTQRTNYTTFKSEYKLDEGHVHFRVAGNKAHYCWSYPDDAGIWQIWTAEMDLDGTNWQATQRTTGLPSKWRPELQIVGDKIYYIWWEGSPSWTAQDIATGGLGSNIINKGASYGLGINENRRVSAFVNDDWTDARYHAESGSSVGWSIFGNISTDWTHVAMTYDKSTLKLYINGELVSQGPLDESMRVNAFDLMIGDDFQGTIDEVRICNRTLSASEIRNTYRLAAGTYYWKVAADDGAKTLVESPTRSFNVVGPDVPILISPADQATVNNDTPEFNWTGTAGDNGVYTLQYALDSGFTQSVVTNSGLTDTNFTPSSLADNTYFWHVEAVDSADIHSGYQAHSLMLTVLTGGGAPQITLVSPPEDSSTLDNSIELEITVSDPESNPMTVWIYGDTLDASDLLYVEKNVASKASITYNWTAPVLGVETGTVGLWHFDEDSGSTAYDETPNNHDGTITGATWTSGKFGAALDFDGDGDHVHVSSTDALKIAGPLTVEAWVNPRSFNPGATGYNVLARKGDDPSQNFIIRAHDSAPSFQIQTGSGSYEAIGDSTDWSTGSWYYIVGVWDGSFARLYLNGVQLDSTSGSGTPNTDDVILSIGDKPAGGAEWDGLIDEFRYTNGALTSAQIASNYRLEQARYSWKVRATDGINDTTTSIAHFNIGPDTEPPEITLNSPSNDSSTTNPYMQLDATVNDNASDTVTVWIYGDTISPPTTVIYQEEVPLTSPTDVICNWGETEFEVRSSTVGLWHFNEGSGTTVADASSYGNDGTIAGATWATGKFGQGLDFDGTDYVEIASSDELKLTGDFTVEAWVKADEWPSAVMVILRKGATSPQPRMNYLLRKDDKNRPCFQVHSTTTDSNFALGDSSDWGPNQWYYLAGVWEGTRIKIYVNGVLEGDSTASGTPQTDNNVLHIGDNTTGGARWRGLIDEVRISRRALSASEIAARYALGDGRYYWSVRASDGVNEDTSKIRYFDIGVPVNDPPEITLLSPPDDSSTTNSFMDLSAEVDDPEGDSMTVRVYGDTIDASDLLYVGTDVPAPDTINYSWTTPVLNIETRTVGLWHFDEGSGGTTYDETDNNHDGTIVGATWTSGGRFGYALDFDGVGDYVEIASSDSLKIAGNMTVEAWVKADEWPSGVMVIARKGASATINYLLRKDDLNRPSFQVKSTTTDSNFALGNPSDWGPDEWYYLAGTWDGVRIKIYVNGVLKGDTACSGTPLTDDGVLHIGDNTLGSAVWRGLIDEVRISRRALSAEEIEANYQLEAGTYYWKVAADDGITKTLSVSETRSFTIEPEINDPPEITLLSPPQDSSSTDPHMELSALVDDPEGDPMTVYFYGDQNPDPTTLIYQETDVSAPSTVTYNWRGEAHEFEVEGTKGTTVGLWHFNENSGSTAYDETADNHDGTITGATWTTGKFGAALDFDGTGDHVHVSSTDALKIAGPLTVEAWVNPRSFRSGTTGYNVIARKGDDGTANFIIRAHDSAPSFEKLTNQDKYEAVGTSSDWSTGSWYYVVGVWDGSFARLYLNGVQIDSVATLGTPFTDDQVLAIGDKPAGGAEWDGLIDEVRYTNGALTAEDIANTYRLEEGTYYWKVAADDGAKTLTVSETRHFFIESAIGHVSLIPSFQVDEINDVDTLWIHLDDNLVDVEAATFKITYDENYITPDTVIDGPDLPASHLVDFTIYPEDSILIYIGILEGNFDGPGSLVGIVLTADTFVDTTRLNFERSTLRDPENQDIPHTTQGAGIQIIVTDITPPTVEVTAPASGDTLNYLPTLTIDFYDSAGLDRGYYQIDGCTGAWTELWSYNSNSSDTSVDWTVPSVSEGTHNIYFKVTDDVGNGNEDSCIYSWSFTYDITLPDPPTGLTVQPGHEKCKLSWTNSSGDDFRGVMIRRNPWCDYAYPEYDDTCAAIGYPTSATEGDSVFKGLATTFRDSSDTSAMPRNVYYYSIFSYDRAGNYSALAVGDTGRATNYWLGDVTGDGNVYFQDLVILSSTFWTFAGVPNYDPKFDIGPTYNMSPKGIPTTDNVIDFEDLVIFAINFAAVNPNLKIAPIFADQDVSGPLVLSLVMPQGDLEVGKEFEVKVVLRNNPGTVKGIHFVLPYDPSQLEFVRVDRSDGLKGAPCPVFFDGRDTDRQVDVSLALLGGKTTIGGSGEIASITFRLLEGNLSLSFSLIDLRGGENHKLLAGQEDGEYEGVSQVPSAYGLSQNYPNPYNPHTQIAYQLPQEGLVSLKIYNIKGELVRTLVAEYKPAGYHTVTWDGRNEDGMEVSSGIYFYRMVSGEFSATKKMVMIK
jgi:hypothetical protein